MNQLPRSEAIRLLSLEHEDLDLREKEEQLKETAKHWLSPFVMVSRPTQIGAGLIGLLFGLTIFASLFMSKYKNPDSVIANINTIDFYLLFDLAFYEPCFLSEKSLAI